MMLRQAEGFVQAEKALSPGKQAWGIPLAQSLPLLPIKHGVVTGFRRTLIRDGKQLPNLPTIKYPLNKNWNG
jgi:hypothetical protein